MTGAGIQARAADSLQLPSEKETEGTHWSWVSPKAEGRARDVMPLSTDHARPALCSSLVPSSPRRWSPLFIPSPSFIDEETEVQGV